MLIVGTRGRSLGGMQGLLPGSVSKYCLQQSPIPVIVVRPSTKREKKKKKRQADPSRRSYNHILRMSEAKAGRLFDKSENDSSSTKLPEGEEATAVANAIGQDSPSNIPAPHLGDHPHPASMSKESLISGCTTGDEDDGDSSWRRSSSTMPNQESPTLDFSSVVLKSPALGVLDSPNLSDDTDADEDGDEDDDEYTHDDSSRVTPLSTNGNGSDPSFMDDAKEEPAVSQQDEVAVQENKEAIPKIEIKSIPDIAAAAPTANLSDQSTSDHVDKEVHKTGE